LGSVSAFQPMPLMQQGNMFQETLPLQPAPGVMPSFSMQQQQTEHQLSYQSNPSLPALQQQDRHGHQQQPHVHVDRHQQVQNHLSSPRRLMDCEQQQQQQQQQQEHSCEHMLQSRHQTQRVQQYQPNELRSFTKFQQGCRSKGIPNS
jgi:hypothetical protein